MILRDLIIYNKCVILLILITYSNTLAQISPPNERLPISDFSKKPKTKWVFEIMSPIYSSPIVSEDLVYFGGLDSIFYAIDISTGHEKWRFRTKGEIRSTPLIYGTRVFLNGGDGSLYALDKKSGEIIWKFKTVGHRFFPVGEVQGSPAIFSNLVFIGARDYNVYAIDQAKGYCHWNKSFTKGWGLNNNIHDSILYIGTADERVLIAADPLTGQEFWKKDMEFLIFGNSAFSNSLLYVGTTIGKLHAISLFSGDKLWSFETNSYKEKRYKYFKPDDTYRDDIYSIIKSNEQFLDVECELGGIFSTPYIDNNIIIFSSTNGTLYCLEK